MTRLFCFRLFQNSLLLSSRHCSCVPKTTIKSATFLYELSPSKYKVIPVKMESDNGLCLGSIFDETIRGSSDQSESLNSDLDGSKLSPLVDHCCKVSANTAFDNSLEMSDDKAEDKIRKSLASSECSEVGGEDLPTSTKLKLDDQVVNEESQSVVKNVKLPRKRNKRKKDNRKLENETEHGNKTDSISESDEVTQTEENPKMQKAKQNKTKKKKNRNEEAESGEDEINDSKKKPPKKQRPNYFIAVRVSNPAIHSTIKVIQDSIISKEPLLKPALIPLGTLHITLMVMHLKKDQLQQAVDILHCCKDDLKKAFEDSHVSNITFQGLGHFKNEVLFGKISGEDEVKLLQSLVAIIQEGYSKDEMAPQKDSQPFKAHLTIMKLSRVPRKKKTKKLQKLQPDTYSAWVDCELGQETISEVLLCSMVDHKEEDGFYHCVGSVDISSSANEETSLSTSSSEVEKQGDISTRELEVETNVEIEEKTKVKSPSVDILKLTAEYAVETQSIDSIDKLCTQLSQNDELESSHQTHTVHIDMVETTDNNWKS